MNLEFGAATDIGRNPRRSANEDSLGVFSPASDDIQESLFVLCDGLGGHGGGELASKIAVAVIHKEYVASRRTMETDSALQKAFRAAHRAIIEAAAAGGKAAKMGTTALAAVAQREEVTIGHVGDSRAYRIASGRAERLTEDHTLHSGSPLAEGTPAASDHSHVLLRSLTAVRPDVDVDIRRILLTEGEALVLCTDGLWAAVPEAVIARTVEAEAPQAAADALVHLANRAGGQDNATVIVVLRGRRSRSAEDDTGEHPLLASPRG
jgi:protein phosphatase